MQIVNKAKGPRIMPDGTETVPGAIATVDDKRWAKWKEGNKVVQGWLKSGAIEEVSGAPAAPQVSATVNIVDDISKATKPPAKTEPKAEKPAKASKKAGA